MQDSENVPQQQESPGTQARLQTTARLLGTACAPQDRRLQYWKTGIHELGTVAFIGEPLGG